jgi:hypothetical protein
MMGVKASLKRFMVPVVIYALANPGNPQVPRYIGATARPLGERLLEHCNHANRLKGSKDPWVLLNISTGGKGCPGVPASPLSSAKLIIRNKQPWSDERRRNLGLAKTGVKHPPESVQKRLASDGWKRLNQSLKRKVTCNETGQVFESLSACARFFNKHPSGILFRIRKNKPLNGLTFSYGGSSAIKLRLL